MLPLARSLEVNTTNKDMLNTKEGASYLNINEKQFYRLIYELKSLGVDPGAINPPNR